MLPKKSELTRLRDADGTAERITKKCMVLCDGCLQREKELPRKQGLHNKENKKRLNKLNKGGVRGAQIMISTHENSSANYISYKYKNMVVLPRDII